MMFINNNKFLITSLTSISVFINLIAIVLIFSPFKLETKRQHSQSFVPHNVKVTNTLIDLIEKKRLVVTRAELISAIGLSNKSKDLLVGEKVDRSINKNSYDMLHFDVINDAEVIDNIWIESPRELPVD